MFPKQNLVEGLSLACVGRFLVDEAEKDGWPQLGAKAWWTLAHAIIAKGCGDGGGGGGGAGLVVVEYVVVELG